VRSNGGVVDAAFANAVMAVALPGADRRRLCYGLGALSSGPARREM
jgi:hypothetical protein